MGIDELKSIVRSVLERSGVRRAGLFGSCVHGAIETAGDVDILVELDDDMGLLDFVGIKQDLEATLGRAVDLVEYSTLKPLIRDNVLKQQVRIL